MENNLSSKNEEIMFDVFDAAEKLLIKNIVFFLKAYA